MWVVLIVAGPVESIAVEVEMVAALIQYPAQAESAVAAAAAAEQSSEEETKFHFRILGNPVDAFGELAVVPTQEAEEEEKEGIAVEA